MSNQVAFAKLCDVLALLYSDEARARRIVADAGINASQILFSTRSIDNTNPAKAAVA